MTHHRLKKTAIQDHSGNLESTNFHWNVLGSFITNLLENTWVFIYYLLEKWIFFFTSWLFNLKLEVITLQLAFTNWVVDVGAAHANCLAASIVLWTFAENMFRKFFLLTRQNFNSSRNSFIRICFRHTIVLILYYVCFIFILWDAYKSLVVCICQMTNVSA